MIVDLHFLCPYTNITTYLTPGHDTAKVTLPGSNTGSVPKGIYQFIKSYYTVECQYYVNVLGKL